MVESMWRCDCINRCGLGVYKLKYEDLDLVASEANLAYAAGGPIGG